MWTITYLPVLWCRCHTKPNVVQRDTERASGETCWLTSNQHCNWHTFRGAGSVGPVNLVNPVGNQLGDGYRGIWGEDFDVLLIMRYMTTSGDVPVVRVRQEPADRRTQEACVGPTLGNSLVGMSNWHKKRWDVELA
jgi:hypothetical protein